MSKPVVHPGKVLAEELIALGVTPAELARQIDVPANRISQIINGKRSISGDTALRLAHWFGSCAEFWLNLQTAHDLQQAERAVGPAIRRLPTRARLTQRTNSSRAKAVS